MTGVSIGNRSPDWVPDGLDAIDWPRRVVLVLWSDFNPHQATAGDIAAALHVRPETPERVAVSDALTTLRERRLAKYDDATRPFVWRLTADGRDEARKRWPRAEKRRSADGTTVS